MKLQFKKALLLSIVSGILLVSCSKDSDSPTFPPGTVLEITGKYLDEDGDAFSDREIMFRNLRQFGYVDETGVAIGSAVRLLGTVAAYAAFPFFFFYDNVFSEDPTTVDRSKYEEKPNYKLSTERTDGDGVFTFKVKADEMLRDSDGGINIVIVNEKADAPLFGKYAFVVKKEDTDLGTLQLCTLGGIAKAENATDDTVTFTWTAPTTEVSRYVLRFGLPESGNMVWTEVVDGALTTATFPRALFHNQPMRLAIEGYYTFSGSKKISCLTAPLDFSVTSPTTSKASGALATTSSIKFTINSLTNGKFSDNMFFEAFDPRGFDLDLGESKTFSKMAFFNLKLHAEGDVKVSGSSDGVTFTEIESFEEKRFLLHTFAAPVTTRYLRFEFSARLIDLQELALF